MCTAKASEVDHIASCSTTSAFLDPQRSSTLLGDTKRLWMGTGIVPNPKLILLDVIRVLQFARVDNESCTAGHIDWFLFAHLILLQVGI